MLTSKCTARDSDNTTCVRQIAPTLVAGEVVSEELAEAVLGSQPIGDDVSAPSGWEVVKLISIFML